MADSSDTRSDKPDGNNKAPEADKLPDGWYHATSGLGQSTYLLRNPKKPADKPTPAFNLHTGAYYNVVLYVTVGMLYPKTKDRFNELVPEAQCKTLIDKVPTAWSDLRDALVGVQNNCEAFNNASMASWGLITNDVITYAIYANDQIGSPGGMTEALEVLCGDKYKPGADGKEPTKDSTFDKNVKKVMSICKDLKSNAESYRKSCQDHYSKLSSFHTTTMTDKIKIDTLDYNFNAVKDKDGNDRECYSNYVNSKLSAVRADMKNQLDIAKKNHEEYEHDVVVAATTPTYGWWFPIGTAAAAIVAGIYGAKAEEARKNYERAEKTYAEDLKKESALVALCNWTSHMGEQIKDMDTIMQAALDSMKSIEDMFNNQARGLGLIASYLGNANNNFNQDYDMRLNTLSAFNSAATRWNEVSDLAQKFLDSRGVDITKQKDAASVGNVGLLSGAAPPPDPSS